MDKFIQLNVAIIPTKEVSEYAIKVSKELSNKYKTEFVLDGRNYFPHVTVYPVEIARKNFKEFIDKTNKVVSHVAKFNITFGKFWSASDHGEYWVGIPVTNSEKLTMFREQIVNSLNSESKVRSIAFETYKPHLTITSIVSEDIPENLVLSELKNKTMEVNRIGVFEMGLHGTCKKLIYEFELLGKSKS